MANLKVFLDMDGVLADFVGGASEAHNRLSPYLNDQGIGVWDMEKLWGITSAEFWKPTNNFDFWFNLEKTLEADAIVQLAIDAVGVKNVAILTSPSLDPCCVPAKRAWVEKCYPQLAKTMIFSWGKGMIGGPQRILIDDRDRNIDDWEEAGGYGILVPRPWNVAHEESDIALLTIQAELGTILSMGAEHDSISSKA